MEIRIDPHTLERARERGASEAEIKDVIEQGLDIPARGNRRARARVYPFDQSRLGKHYPEKRVEVIYVTEGNVLVTVTVYVFFGKWGNENADSV